MPKDCLYVVWGNTDLTEGRGMKFPLYLTKLETTANRLAVGNYIMGSACPVEEVKIITLADNRKVIPIEYVYIEEPTKEDKTFQESIDAKREVIKRLGISDSDVRILGINI